MSLVLMVSANFPGASPEKRGLIDECLAGKKWQKVANVSTTWFATFTEDFTEAEAIEAAVSDFQECAKPREAILAIQIGVKKPTLFPPPPTLKRLRFQRRT